MDDYPVRILAHEDDFVRPRLTVLLRLPLLILPLIWVFIWGVVALVAVVLLWIGAVVTGTRIPVLARIVAGWVRYSTRVTAYGLLVANPWPGFWNDGTYPVDLEIDVPQRVGRLSALFRLILAIPALLLTAGMVGGYGGTTKTTGRGETQRSDANVGVALAAAFLTWFAVLATGRQPTGLRNVSVYVLRFRAEAMAYALLLTDRYPRPDPAIGPVDLGAVSHPVWLDVADDLRRSRLTVFFRLLLAIPHIVWLVLWTILLFFVAILNWIATLLTGTPPALFHRFISAYLRYSTHVTAFIYLAANPFPPFGGRPGSYPVEVQLPERERQPRLVTLVRIVLALPAALISSSIGVALVLAAVFLWFIGVFLGRSHEGLRNLVVFGLRYSAQLTAYVLLLTARYPYSGPVLAGEDEAVGGTGEVEPALA